MWRRACKKLNVPQSLAGKLLKSHFSLLQPKGHLHVAVTRCGICEVLSCLSSVSSLYGQFAEAQLTVGDKRRHRELNGECLRLSICIDDLETMSFPSPTKVRA
jgi:hypothetical protein